jgi:hypothetical protein
MLLFILAHIAGAYYNYYCILGAEWNAEYSKKWHLWQAISMGLIATYIGGYVSPYYAIQFLTARFLVFNPMLNYLRGKGFFYLGNHGIDSIFLKLFGKLGGLVYFILGLLLVVGMYLLHLHYDILNYSIYENYK